MSAYRDAILADNPVNYWRLGESSGDALDEKGVHDLTWFGSPIYGVEGALTSDTNTGMTLNGSSAYAYKAVSNYRASDYQGSIEAWAKLTARDQIIFGSSDEDSSQSWLQLRVDNNSDGIKIRTSASGSIHGVVGTTPITDGEWHHLVATSNGSIYALYVDGEPETLIVDEGTNSGNWFSDLLLTRDNISLGAFRYTATVAFVGGSIDEAAVYDYPLSADQVLAHYNIGRAVYACSGIITDRFGVPCQRAVYAMSRPIDGSTPQVLAHGLSDPSTGAYELIIPTAEEVTRVVVSEDDDPFREDLVNRVIPG